ncbi:histidine phosphatase family protein [Caldichromatium japonicum]|uniref:Histidine phosphatase family protein n=1 Tax=Caldichromatium japonicum TaxID=2699430 RepID=A0A6G7VE38_9GAMM|nr:histidine phosphatase family protein [Caldichromatium japonicum]QIK38057.1 histidine phosphatase family protein [Caldichromatium japonicum]
MTVDTHLIDLLRHGDCVGGPCFRGVRDDPLSRDGWQQMEQATAGLAGLTQVISSPSRRCAEFAQSLASRLGLSLVLMDHLRERDFGDWEGLSAAEIPAAEFARFLADPTGFNLPNAEPFGAFRARVLATWQALCASPSPHRLLITHGGVIRVLVAEVLRMDDTALPCLEVPPACLTRIRLHPPPGRPSLVYHRPSTVDELMNSDPDQP